MQTLTPDYLNLEYLFGLFYRLLVWIGSLFTGEFFWLRLFLTIMIILLFAVIFYTLIRLREIDQKEAKELKEIIVQDPEVATSNPRWDIVKNHIESTNPAEWRMAIIEADLILDELVMRMGYKGETLGERLKVIERSDFTTLQNAWDAHKIRNQIAHEGSAFTIDQKEAEHTVALYETVFREFKYI